MCGRLSRVALLCCGLALAPSSGVAAFGMRKRGNAANSTHVVDVQGHGPLARDALSPYVLHSIGEDSNPTPNNAMTMLLGAGNCGGVMQSKCGCGWANECSAVKCVNECNKWEECLGVVVHTEQNRCWLLDGRWAANNFHTIPAPTRQIFVKGDYVTADLTKASANAKKFGQGPPGYFVGPKVDKAGETKYYWTISWVAAYFHPVEEEGR